MVPTQGTVLHPVMKALLEQLQSLSELLLRLRLTFFQLYNIFVAFCGLF